MGDTTCRFCDALETIDHLSFDCIAAKYVWGVVSLVIGARSRPRCFTQCVWWMPRQLIVNRIVQIVDLVVICWAIWKMRNKVCFQKKSIQSIAEIICYACSFLKYWTGLKSDDDKRDTPTSLGVLQLEALRHHVAQIRVDHRRLEALMDDPEERSKRRTDYTSDV